MQGGGGSWKLSYEKNRTNSNLPGWALLQRIGKLLLTSKGEEFGL